jgi:FMN phosphatase YigB (HAD superfamily)
MTGFKPEDCIFIDDRVRNLTPARNLGFHTVLFDAEKLIGDSTEHDVVTNFKELNDLIFGKPASHLD